MTTPSFAGDPRVARKNPRICSCGREYQKPSDVRRCERSGHAIAPSIDPAMSLPVGPVPVSAPAAPALAPEVGLSSDTEAALKTTILVLAQQLAETQAELIRVSSSR